MCGLQSHSRHSLTVAARPIESAVESGGLVFAVVNGRQTGNTGVIPGRPRRCIRAIPRCRHVLREEMRPPRGDRPADFRAIVVGPAIRCPDCEKVSAGRA